MLMDLVRSDEALAACEHALTLNPSETDAWDAKAPPSGK